MARRNPEKTDPELIGTQPDAASPAPQNPEPQNPDQAAPHPMAPVDPTIADTSAPAEKAAPAASEPTRETVARREKTGLFPYQQCNLRRAGKLCGSWNTSSRSTTIIDGDRGTRMHVRHRWCHDCNAAYKAVSRLPAETD